MTALEPDDCEPILCKKYSSHFFPLRLPVITMNSLIRTRYFFLTAFSPVLFSVR
jgi:hypothetical protein